MIRAVNYSAARAAGRWIKRKKPRCGTAIHQVHHNLVINYSITYGYTAPTGAAGIFGATRIY
jgi:hypothetical protein